MTYLRNCWYVAAASEELTDKPMARTLLDTPVMLYRGESGTPFALDRHCPHRFAPLDQGIVTGDKIACPYHGLQFDGQGKCVFSPSGDEPPPHARLRSYPLVERHAMLWIWMGNAALADPSVIPDFSYMEGPDFGWYTGYLHVQGNYELVVDNLLDLTHTEFLHPMLSSAGWTSRNEQTITQTGDTIHVLNVAQNDMMSPLLQQMRPDLPPVGTHIQEERWDAPSHLRLYFEFQSGGEKLIIPSAHFLTPETPTTTHYIVRGGHQENRDQPGYTAMVRAGVLGIFSSEDVPMIEAQQRFIGGREFMECQPAILKMDAAAIRARRLLAKKIRGEQIVAPAAAAA